MSCIPGGVLHHTGHMMQAFESVSSLVKEWGYLFISIYNDQGSASRRWTWIKKKYNQSGFLVRKLIEVYTFFRCWTITMVKDLLKSGNPFQTIQNYAINSRGMTVWCDIVDWSGGYPFEVAKPDVVFDFFDDKGFRLKRLKICKSFSCNEFVFMKE